MPCLVALLSIFVPRFVLFCMFLFSTYLGRAYQTNTWPFLGFFFAPFTTLAYACAMNENNRQLTGVWLAIFIVAILADLGFFRSQARSRPPRMWVANAPRPGGPSGRRQVRNEAE